MAYIQSHQELARHPKTLKAAALLDVSVPAVIGHLHMLWWWALDYAPDGDVHDFDAYDLALGSGWCDAPDTFVAALENAGPGSMPGFLERDDCGRLVLHDWDEYGGKMYEKRLKDAARKREMRAAKAAAPPVQQTSDGRPTDVARTAHVEEKRGEERRGQELSSSDADATDTEEAPVWADDVVTTCREVARMIAANGHALPTSGTKRHTTWLTEMDRLLRLGPPGQTTTGPPTPVEVIEVARWATGDEFWKSNIASIPKLRKQWSQLAIKARAKTSGGGVPTGMDAIAAFARRTELGESA